MSIRLLFFTGLMAVAVATFKVEAWYYKIPIWILIVLGCYTLVNFVAKD